MNTLHSQDSPRNPWIVILSMSHFVTLDWTTSHERHYSWQQETIIVQTDKQTDIHTWAVLRSSQVSQALSSTRTSVPLVGLHKMSFLLIKTKWPRASTSLSTSLITDVIKFVSANSTTFFRWSTTSTFSNTLFYGFQRPWKLPRP